MNENKTEFKLDTVVDFGKHKLKTIRQIIEEDPTYIYWMFDKKFNLSKEVVRASNTKTKERLAIHRANKTNQIKTYGSGYTIDEKGIIITQHEQGLRDMVKDLNKHMYDKYPELMEDDGDDF